MSNADACGEASLPQQRASAGQYPPNQGLGEGAVLAGGLAAGDGDSAGATEAGAGGALNKSFGVCGRLVKLYSEI